MDDGFCHVVRRALNDAKARTRPSDTLMMRAVDGKGRTVKGAENASGLCLGGMHLILETIFVEGMCRQILNDASTEIDINQLHAFADAENGKPSFSILIEQGELSAIQNGFDDAGAMVGLSEQRRIDVAAAWKNKRVGIFRLPVGKKKAAGAELCQCILVIVRLIRRLGDENSLFGHEMISS